MLFILFIVAAVSHLRHQVILHKCLLFVPLLSFKLLLLLVILSVEDYHLVPHWNLFLALNTFLEDVYDLMCGANCNFHRRYFH